MKICDIIRHKYTNQSFVKLHNTIMGISTWHNFVNNWLSHINYEKKKASF